MKASALIATLALMGCMKIPGVNQDAGSPPDISADQCDQFLKDEILAYGAHGFNPDEISDTVTVEGQTVTMTSTCRTTLSNYIATH